MFPYWFEWIGFAQKFGPASFRPSPRTFPENGTNPSADLVEAVSSVICEEITWRPIFFRCWFRSILDRVQSFLPESNYKITSPDFIFRQFFTSNQVLASNARQFVPVTLNQLLTV